MVDVITGSEMKKIHKKEIDVPDIKGHVLRVFEIYEKIVDTKLCNGDSLVSRRSYASTDDIDHDGRLSGYDIYTSAKGDQLFVEVTATAQRRPGEELSTHQGIGRIVGGLGYFEGFSGDYQDVIQFNNDKKVSIRSTQTLRYKIEDKDAKK